MADVEFNALRQYLESDLRQPPFAEIRARRGRRSRLVAMTAATLAILVVTVWSVAAPRQHADRLPIGPSPTAGSSPAASSAGPDFPVESIGAFPARIVLPGPAAAPLLPTGRGVGAAVFVVGYPEEANGIVVTRDGPVFEVPATAGRIDLLSPDGRWLGLERNDNL